MSTKTIKTTILLRNDISSSWATHNPTLSAGEAGYDRDHKYLKIGDGATAWNDLDTIRLSATAIDGLSEAVKDTNTIFKLQAENDGKALKLLSADGMQPSPLWQPSGISVDLHNWTGDISTAISANLSVLSADDTPTAHEFVTAVSQKDGKIAVTRAALSADDIPELSDRYDVAGAAASVLGEAADNISCATVYGVKNYAEALSTYVKDETVKQDELNTPLTGGNKVATMADVAGLSGCIHFRGTFTNDPSADGGKPDWQAMFDAFKTEDMELTDIVLSKGDVAINTFNGLEYLTKEDLSAGETSAVISASIAQIGDEQGFAKLIEKISELSGNTTDLSSAITLWGTRAYAEALAHAAAISGQVSAQAVRDDLSSYLKLDDYEISAIAISSTTSATSALAPVDKTVTLGTMALVDEAEYTKDFNDNLNKVVDVLSAPETEPISHHLTVMKVSNAWYGEHIGKGSPLSNDCLYVIDDDYIDAFGRQIKNLSAPAEDYDAATKKYVDDEISSAHDLDTLSVKIENVIVGDDVTVVLNGGDAQA